MRLLESCRLASRGWSAVLVLLACSPAAAATPIADSLTGSQRSAVEEFLAARASGSPQVIAGAIHPAELEELRARLLELLHQEAKRGDSTIRSRLFGQAM